MGNYFRGSSEEQEDHSVEMTGTLRPKKPGQGMPGGGRSQCKGPGVGARVVCEGLAGRPARWSPSTGASGQVGEMRAAWRCSGPGLCVPVPSSGRGESGNLRFSHSLAACGVRGFLFRCPGGLASESCCCSGFRNLPVRHPRAPWEGGRDGLGRLPGPPRLQIWACLPPGSRLGLPCWPLTARGAAAPDTASLGDAHLPWPGSVHTALPAAGLRSPQERFLFLQPVQGSPCTETRRPVPPPGPGL